MSDSPQLAVTSLPTSTSNGSKAKGLSPQNPNNFYPHSPTSPPLMSVGAQSYASNFANTHTSPSHTTSNGQPLSSPPSSTPMSAQTSQQPAVSATNSFPTPASSVSGHPRNTTPADESETADKSWGQQNTNAAMNADPSSNIEHRRSDHDRHKMDTEGWPLSADVDMMDVDTKVDNSLIRDSSLDALQQDIGTAFHLCKSGKEVLFYDADIPFDCTWVCESR
jgi:hypothetical protein